MGMLLDICNDNSIRVISDRTGAMEEFAGGASTYIKGDACAIIDANANIWEQRITLAHEMAHLLFGHLNTRVVSNFETCEQEAQIFSATITALIMFEEYRCRSANKA